MNRGTFLAISQLPRRLAPFASHFGPIREEEARVESYTHSGLYRSIKFPISKDPAFGCDATLQFLGHSFRADVMLFRGGVGMDTRDGMPPLGSWFSCPACRKHLVFIHPLSYLSMRGVEVWDWDEKGSEK